MITGRCECGLVSFEADCEISDFSHCHCSQCRRLHGAAYATFAEVRRDRFRYRTGEDAIATYESSPKNTRVFCSNCGSAILVAPRNDPEWLYLSMSAVEGNPEHPPAYHAWVGSKAPWHEITDGAKQYQKDPTE